MATNRLMISVASEIFKKLSAEARSRDISIQELIRAVILSDWVRQHRQGLQDREIATSLTRDVSPNPRQQLAQVAY